MTTLNVREFLAQANGALALGMSSGDPPTDAYEHFDNLGQCPPIMDLLLKWGKEDLEAAGLNPSARPAP